MNPNDETKFEIFHKHYADTFGIILSTAKSRDRFFLVVLLLLGLMAFQVALPAEAGTTVAGIARQKLGITEALSPNFLETVVWAALFFVSVRYYQQVVNLERLYAYIHTLEDELSSHFSGQAFTREGKFYAKDYPLFSKVTSALYSWTFPIGLAFATTVKIVSEFRSNEGNILPHLADGLIYVLLIGTSAFYVLHVYARR